MGVPGSTSAESVGDGWRIKPQRSVSVPSTQGTPTGPSQPASSGCSPITETAEIRLYATFLRSRELAVLKRASREGPVTLRGNVREAAICNLIFARHRRAASEGAAPP